MNASRTPSVKFEISPQAKGTGLHVLVVTNMYPYPDRPFLGLFVRQQVESLRDMGIDVDVLFINGPANKLNYLKGILAFQKLVWRRRYDLIHAHNVYSGAIARMQVRCPVVTTFHGSEFSAGRLENLLSRLTAPRLDAVILVSPVLKRFLPRQQVWVIPCGVDLQRFHPMPQQEARDYLGLPKDKKLILFVGARRPEKRFDLVEQAYSLLEKERQDVELVVVDRTPPEEVPSYMNACDALVLTSDREGSPQVIKEAMACNLPIVSTPVGDVPSVTDGTEGCYLCSQTPEDIAAKLRMALDGGARTNGSERVAHLALDRVAVSILEVYDEVLKSRRTMESKSVSSTESGQ